MRTELPEEMEGVILDMHEENLNEWLKMAQTYRARKNSQVLGSPREIQQQNLAKVLQWVYRWGFSTADIISDLLGRKNRSHARRLAEVGWLRPVSVRGYQTYYVLTEKGLAEALHHANKLHEYKEIDPYRVSLPKLHHDLVVQKETIAAIRRGSFEDFLTPRMFRFKKEDMPLKVPDAILIERFISESKNTVDDLTGMEIELTPKWNHDLDLFITNIIDDLQYSRLRLFLIISDSRAILERYEAAFKPGSKVKRWEKSSGGKFTHTGETLEIPKWVFRHVYFREVGSTEPYPTADLL